MHGRLRTLVFVPALLVFACSPPEVGDVPGLRAVINGDSLSVGEWYAEPWDGQLHRLTLAVTGLVPTQVWSEREEVVGRPIRP